MTELYPFVYAFSAAVMFALFDYFGFNISLKKNWADFSLINKYRISQAVFQLLLTILLYFLSGWQSAAAFSLIWWTWGCDFLFYFFCEIFNYGNDRGNFRKEVLGNIVQWAWWTPYGLLFTKKGDTVKFRVLVVQSLIGFVLAAGITLI